MSIGELVGGLLWGAVVVAGFIALWEWEEGKALLANGVPGTTKGMLRSLRAAGEGPSPPAGASKSARMSWIVYEPNAAGLWSWFPEGLYGALVAGYRAQGRAEPEEVVDAVVGYVRTGCALGPDDLPPDWTWAPVAAASGTDWPATTQKRLPPQPIGVFTTTNQERMHETHAANSEAHTEV